MTSRPARTRAFAVLLAGAAAAALALGLTACGGGGGTRILYRSSGPTPAAALGIPELATRNTTRVAGATPVADAAGVALAVYPSQSSGSHPTAVTVAPTGDWEAALAASVLMAAPIHAPVLLSGTGSLPGATASALSALSPTGAGAADGATVIRVGDVPAARSRRRSATISGDGPYALAAAIDRFQAAAAGRPSPDVVVASSADPSYAMPAAGWAAESGDPILFVSPSGIPAATREALRSHDHPRIFVLGPRSAVGPGVLDALRRFGTVRRVGATGAAANSVAFATYRDPACPHDRPCAAIPGSFGWAMRSPGHGYTLLSAGRTLDAPAAAALSGSGDNGPQLLVDGPDTLPRPVLDFFLNYATPGYTSSGPTVGVYNHGWVIGDTHAISLPVQSELDGLLQIVPVSAR